VEQAAAAAESMREQSGKLSELVAQFNIMEQAQKPVVSATRPVSNRRPPVLTRTTSKPARVQPRQIPQRKTIAAEQDWEEF